MKTRVTELLGIRHPIMLAGMALVSLPKLVAAVSNAGGLGVLNCAAYTPGQIADVVREIKTLTDKPFAVNATMTSPNARENIEVALEERSPVINYALGKGDWIIKKAHTYGGKVLATVATEKHARRAETDGADALVVTGHEAAAHGPEAGTMVLVPLIARQTKLPIIAAGGFHDGKGLAAALALGADGISMGTRLMLTSECEINERAKEISLKAGLNDTIYSEKIDGMPGRFLKTPVAVKMANGALPLLQALSKAYEIKRMVDLSLWKLFVDGLKHRGISGLARQAISITGIKTAVETGDLETGLLPMSQAICLMRGMPSCKEVIEGAVAEAESLFEALREKYHS